MIPTTRKAVLGLAVIGAVGLASAVLWRGYTQSHFVEAQDRFQEESAHAHAIATQRVEGGLKSIYENLRTLAALPSVRNISRHGENFNDEARVTFQQVYNNLASNVRVSEVYVVPGTFDPDKIDPVTGKPEEPILMFDEFIVNAGANNPFKPIAKDTKEALESVAAEIPEEEKFEYAQLKGNMAWFRQNHPTVNAENILDVPIIAGAEVITCDNSYFIQSQKDADRTGLMFSVPFYGMDGAFKGSVTAIILNKALAGLLPQGDFALVNPTHGYVNAVGDPAVLEASAIAIKTAQPDPSLSYSGTRPLELRDPRSKWFVWAGNTPQAYYSSATYRAAVQFQRVGLMTIGLLTLFIAAFWLQSVRNIKKSLKFAAEYAVQKAREDGAAARIERATTTLQGATSPFMLTDDKGQILALNPAAMTMFRHAEEDLKSAVSAFSTDRLLGSSVTQLDHSLLSESPKTETLQLALGDRHFEVTISPSFGDTGERLGSTLEWHDKTVERKTEKQIASIVRAASQGDFTRRIDLSNKHGFLQDLSRGVNELTENVDRGLSEAVRVMSALADGNTKARFSGEFSGSFLRLKSDVNQMADKVSNVIQGIASVSNKVEGSVVKISSGMTHLQNRSQQQAAALEETAATMEQFSATLHQSAAHANQAKGVASQACMTATSGTQIAETAIAAVSRIDESTTRIDEIVALIQEIAFQTNILSLNAAVEAARAGDAGRGFSVVASEVRALAQRTTQASKEINALISRTDIHVQEGVGLVGKTGASLVEINSSVNDVSKLVSEIAHATREQSSGIEQVASAVSQLDHMTQQNNELVNDTREDLALVSRHILDLQKAIGFFSLSEGSKNNETGRARAAG